MIQVTGIVQGVGFRPFVHALASQLALRGSVRNCTGTVLIDVEGDGSSLERFLDELASRPPPLARIEQIRCETQKPNGANRFQIDLSQTDTADQVFVSADVATCAECLAELLDPADRRFGYPFINCTNCGPRLTIIAGAPYDRPQTTMAAFPMCPACRQEYENPGDRRFHAQPVACPECGPQLRLLDAHGAEIAAGDPLNGFVEMLRAGRIGAMKGLGGYHLICDARSESAVRELRRRKQRDEKPLAVMVRDLDVARQLCKIAPAEEELLRSPRAPIVLLRKRNPCAVAESVAPGNPSLGVMLPYTPLHHLLLHAMDGAPLVMTSGNRSDEPIAYQDRDALERLCAIADVFLMHDRPIHIRCDDSVTRVVNGVELPVRRSRGYAPQPVMLPIASPHHTLAVGGQLKATFALGRDRQAFLSHHLGDLDHFEAFRAFERDVALYEDLFAIRPERIAHDLHPDYASTRYALQRGASDGAQLIPVQHHHAHMASCMAEHGLREPVIGVTFDGTGYGTDGTVWGGEFLVGGYRQFRRAAHLRYVGMPGGEQAIREPWRMAIAHLIDAESGCELLRSRISPAAMRTVEAMLQRRFNTPPTSSLGRLFDAVAAIAGVRDRAAYEGQAAMELEWKIPQWSNAIERDRARTYFQAYAAAAALYFVERALKEVHAGRTRTWNEFRVPDEAIGCGFHEAVRGVLSHHMVIRHGKIANYHPYPPTPWNASPRDVYGTPGPYEDAVQNTPIFEENGPDKFKGIDIMRAVRSFDPCLPCGVHMYTGKGKLLETRHVPMFGAHGG